MRSLTPAAIWRSMNVRARVAVAATFTTLAVFGAVALPGGSGGDAFPTINGFNVADKDEPLCAVVTEAKRPSDQGELGNQWATHVRNVRRVLKASAPKDLELIRAANTVVNLYTARLELFDGTRGLGEVLEVLQQRAGEAQGVARADAQFGGLVEKRCGPYTWGRPVADTVASEKGSPSSTEPASPVGPPPTSPPGQAPPAGQTGRVVTGPAGSQLPSPGDQ